MQLSSQDQNVRKQTQDRKTDPEAYWKDNIKLLLKLLIVWFAVSFGAGILFVEPLNKVDFFGMPLGFWFAQQGSIYVFVVLIFVYTAAMRRLERRHGLDDEGDE